MVIATSDAHYVHPHEKRVRDIYINAKAIGNARHPLYFYDRVKRKACKAPDQHLLTTDEMLQAFSWIGEDLAYKIVVENPRELKSMMNQFIQSKINCIHLILRDPIKNYVIFVLKQRIRFMEIIYQM